MSLSSLRVLLVEDNPINQQVARRLLEKQGHTVAVAGNGRQALEVLNEDWFDLVLMDLQMPEMDGLAATAAIRAAEPAGSRRLPIVALTASALPGDRENCLQAGMDGYVTKPVRAEELLQAMAEALENAARSATLT